MSEQVERRRRMDDMAIAFSRAFIKYRAINLAINGGLTIFFGYHALQLQVFSQFIDLLPRNHPYIQIYEKYNRQFGSANVVTAAIIARDGKVYNERFLEKVYGFTDQIDKIDGVDHGQVTSVTHPAVREQEIDREGVMRSRQVVGAEAISLLEAQFFTRRALHLLPKGEQPASIAELKKAANGLRERALDQMGALADLPLNQIPDEADRERVGTLRKQNAELELLVRRLDALPATYHLDGENLIGPDGTLLPKGLIDDLPDRTHQNKQVYGRLISVDDTSALIQAGFIEGRLDYRRIFDQLQELRQELEADGTVEIHLTGQPVLVGWTFVFLTEIILILFASLGVLVGLLGVYFRHWYGVVMPTTGAVVCAIWGLGFTSLMGYQLEPLVLVIPMLITARAVSHSVQFVERFYEEYERLRDKDEAIVSSMAELLLPGTLGTVTDALGIWVIGVSSIALMKKVAIFGSFWSMSIIVTEMLLNRLMIAYFPAPKKTEHYIPKPISWILDHMANWATVGRGPRVIFGVWVVIVAASLWFAPKVTVGEPRPGTPIFYPDHTFNKSAGIISKKFFGADDFMAIVETEQDGGVQRPEVMREIEAFQRYMEQDPKVGGSLSLVDFTKAINRAFHNGDPRWLGIPYTDAEIGGLLYLYEAGSPDPRILNPFRDGRGRAAAVRVFYADHQATTIRNAVERAQEFIRKRPAGEIDVRLEVPTNDWIADAYWWMGPLLPPRQPELQVSLRQGDGSFQRQQVALPGRTEDAPEDNTARILTLPRITTGLRDVLVEAGYDSVQKLADADVEELAQVEGFDLVTAYALIKCAELDRRNYTVVAEWQDQERATHAQVRKRGLYEPYELWVQFQNGDWQRRESGRWAQGTSWALASGLMGVLGASNDEVEGSNNATLIASFTMIFLVIWISYRSFAMSLLMLVSLGTAALVSLAYMYLAGIGFDVNTLPVQGLGVGVGVDYALYIMDRVVRERQRGHDMEESLRIAIKTTGMAVFFTGSTLVGGIIFWVFLSSLRFAADMSLLLSILLLGNMIGAMLLVPAFTAIFKPSFAYAIGTEVQPDEPDRGVPDESEPRRSRVATSSTGV